MIGVEKLAEFLAFVEDNFLLIGEDTYQDVNDMEEYTRQEVAQRYINLDD